MVTLAEQLRHIRAELAQREVNGLQGACNPDEDALLGAAADRLEYVERRLAELEPPAVLSTGDGDMDLAYALRWGARYISPLSWLRDAMRRAADRLDASGPEAVPSPGPAQLRHFLVTWEHHWTDAPAPGSFVMCGPAGAAWRLHAWDRAAVGGALVTLEPVDVHDVPILGRLGELAPVADVTGLPADHPHRQTAEPVETGGE